MDDLISRQAAIERIVRIRPSTPKQSDYSHGVDVGMAMAIVAIEEQPSAHTELRWIPVEEKLPEVGESVLVTFSLIEKYSCVKIARYGTPIHDEYNVCFYESDSEWGDCEISGVTAWMPLPETYKAESEDKE